MLDFINGKGKYILPAALLLLIVFAIYFTYVFDYADNKLIMEKYDARIMTTDVLCETIDTFVELSRDWNEYDYDAVLASITAFIDASGEDASSYAELFDADLNSLSERTPYFPDTPFVLKDYQELEDAVIARESGRITLWFDKSDEPHDIYLYWRWVPTDSTLNNRLLLVTGVTKYSVNNAITQDIKNGAILIVGLTAALIVAAAILLTLLGNVYDKRKSSGDECKREVGEWRAEISS